jgi:hypothetical protein
MTVTLPFHVFTLDPQGVEETSDQYKERIQQQAQKNAQHRRHEGQSRRRSMAR